MSAKVAAFRRLHESGCFVIPNPWDRGSAIFLEKAGFKALASTSAGFAWSHGRPDNKVTADQVVGHLEEIASRRRRAGQRGFRGRVCRRA